MSRTAPVVSSLTACWALSVTGEASFDVMVLPAVSVAETLYKLVGGLGLVEQPAHEGAVSFAVGDDQGIEHVDLVSAVADPGGGLVLLVGLLV